MQFGHLWLLDKMISTEYFNTLTQTTNIYTL